MSNWSNINQTFVIEPFGSPIISACTSLFTNNIISCSGDTQIFLKTGVITFDGNLYTNSQISASTINASTYYSGGTNIIDIINYNNITGGTFDNISDTLTLFKDNGNQVNVTGLTDYYTTGSTIIGTTAYFDRNDSLSAYTLNLDLFTADIYVTGVTFSDNQLVILRNDGLNLNTFINTFTALTVNGLLSSSSVSATTITSLEFIGDGSKITGMPYVTGGTYSNSDALFTNSTGGTFSVTGLTDYFVTGGTFNKNSKILTLNRNDSQGVEISIQSRILIPTTAQTVSNETLIIDTISGFTDDSNSFIVSYVNAYKDNTDFGFWKRTLAISKVNGTVTVIGENSDFDRVSSGITSNSVVYSANSGNVSIIISGETSKNYNWSSNWEIIK